MSISASIREKLLNSFREELKEHIQTMTDGLLALEQQTVAGEDRREMLDRVFRAAHSLKGAARAVGATMVEQLAHALEDVLDAMRRDTIELHADLFTACYQAFDAIQGVHAAYEAGALTPPPESMQALLDLQKFRGGEGQAKEPAKQPTPTAAPAMAALAPGKAEVSAAAALESADFASVSDVPPELGAPAAVAMQEPASVSAPLDNGSLGGDTDETIRVKVSKLDALMAQLSELMVTKIRAEQRLTQLRRLEEDIALWQKEWLAVRGLYSRLVRHSGNGDGQKGHELVRLLDYVGESQEQLRELNTRVSNLSREYASDTMQMSLVIDELEEEVKRVRMLPLSTIIGPFGRMVRDLAHDAGKQAVLRIVGGETELDKRVLEQIKDPLIHLLRNAVDHGLEAPADREIAGKPAYGTITLTAEQLGKDIVLSVADDGGGLDLDAVRASVARHDPAAAQVMNEAELKGAIFNVGISTKDEITDISGRGVGLDVVRRNVEALHGRIDVASEPGAGTAFTLTLPLTLSSSRGLLVHVSDDRFAIPLTSIERIGAVATAAVTTLGGFDAVRYEDTVIPLVRLGDVLEMRCNGHGAEQFAYVVLASAERRVAFVVDELAVEQEIVIKGLGKQLQRVGGIAGATVMGSGEIVLILNVADLIRMALRDKRRALKGKPEGVAQVALDAAQAARANGGNSPNGGNRVSGGRQHILIVDDSITTRTLEKNILEAAGYRVRLATDGQEAWDLIAAGDLPDLVVSDVSMPRLDGIGLTKRIKGDAQSAQLPVILVTSLDSPQDKARGVEAGADAYITKGAFDQSNLLSTIEQLI